MSTIRTSDPHAYLKWPRLIMFNLNGALSIAATGVSARSFVVLNHDRSTLASQIPGAKLQTTDVVAVTAIMCTAAGLASIYTAVLSTIITLKLQKVETLRTIRIKYAIMSLLGLFLLGSAIAATVVIVPRSAGVSAPGIPTAFILAAIKASGKSLAYKDSLAFPTLILVWITFGTTLICFFLAILAALHIKKYGPENTTVGHTVSKAQASHSDEGLVHSDKADMRHVERV